MVLHGAITIYINIEGLWLIMLANECERRFHDSLCIIFVANTHLQFHLVLGRCFEFLFYGRFFYDCFFFILAYMHEKCEKENRSVTKTIEEIGQFSTWFWRLQIWTHNKMKENNMY